MKNTDIESLLRENKPQVKDNPTFLLEVQEKMRAVDGIRSEVERQRRYGRMAMMAALFVGLLLGGMVAAFAYLYPAVPESIVDSIPVSVMAAISPWKHYILSLLVAGCAIALGVIYSSKKESSTIL